MKIKINQTVRNKMTNSQLILKRPKKERKSNKILTTLLSHREVINNFMVTLSPSRLQPVIDCDRYHGYLSNPIIT